MTPPIGEYITQGGDGKGQGMSRDEKINLLIDDMAKEVEKAERIENWKERMAAQAAIARAYSYMLKEANG